MNFDDLLEDIKTKGWSQQLGVLSKAELTAINEFFDQRKPEFGPAKVGAAENKQRNDLIRGDYTFWVDPLETPPALKPLVEKLNKVRELMNMSFYMGLKEYECHLAYYPPGAFYQKHVDRFETGSTRTLSFIFYLHEEWRPEDKGALILYEKKNMLSLLPHPGSFVCFLSEDFPHEVMAGNKERRSFTGWMHTKILT